MNNAMVLVLIKMCSYVGVRFEDVDFKEEKWYLNHSWTAEQEKDFCDWLVNKIRTDNDIRKGLTTLSYKPSIKRTKSAVIWFMLWLENRRKNNYIIKFKTWQVVKNQI